MADFSLTTLFVVPVGQTVLPSADTISTQDLTPGQVGIFRNDYSVADAGNIAAAPYFYVAQGRTNNYLQGSKRSDKIKGGAGGNVTEWYKVTACPTPVNQITDVTDFNVKCGDVVTLTLRAFSSYINTLYFNGFTRSVTVQAPCCDCGADPCETTDVNALINQLIEKLTQDAPGINPDNISFNTFYEFANVGGTTLRITGKALTKYGVPCDVAAFPWEFDRMWFRTFVMNGPATTADFIVDDACDVVANAAVIQRSSYAKGTSDEVTQLEKNFYSYQAGYMKHLFRMVGYNQNYESWVSPGTNYDLYYIKFNEFNKAAYVWGDYIHEDATVIIAAASGGAFATAIETVLVAGLGAVVDDSGVCITTTTTTTLTPPSTTTTTSTLIP